MDTFSYITALIWEGLRVALIYSVQIVFPIIIVAVLSRLVKRLKLQLVGADITFGIVNAGLILYALVFGIIRPLVSLLNFGW
jgi:hypothetical protein